MTDRYNTLLSRIKDASSLERFSRLYGSRDGELSRQISRCSYLVKKHEDIFHTQAPLCLISSPGRIEIIGNHTDHNHGRVLAAAVNLDTLAVVSPSEGKRVRIHSEGFAPMDIDLNDLDIHEEEKGTSAALVRGVARGMADDGFRIGGFDACITSNVLSGSGLSSSAAYEVLICAVFDHLYNGNMNPVRRAEISQFAENQYFGKPSGLMDQMACSVGGMVAIDFKDKPVIEPMDFRFSQCGYDIVVVNTGSSHDNLTNEYASIREEMNAVAACFGEPVLRRVRPEQVWQAIPELRKKVGDRPILRAEHFFAENERVKKMTRDVKSGNLEGIFRNIIASGESSWMLLQNVYADKNLQPLALAQMMASEFLDSQGAWRVHGGGFAGTTLNFVPQESTAAFVEKFDAVFGRNACYVLDVRSEGAALLLE